MAGERYRLIDGVRGLAVINMVAHHFLYDVHVVYGLNSEWPLLPSVHIWQQFICWTFILVSGFSWRLGRKHNLHRGLLLNFYGLVITAVTMIAVPSETIWFGILNFIGCAILLTIPLDMLLDKIPGWLGISLSFILFFFFRHTQQGYLGFGNMELIQLPLSLYTKLTTPFGFPYAGFRSSDYFPLLPWFFLFLVGYFFYSEFIVRESWRKTAMRRVPLLSSIGQKTLWIYLLHQPLCMLVSMILFG